MFSNTETELIKAANTFHRGFHAISKQELEVAKDKIFDLQTQKNLSLHKSLGLYPLFKLTPYHVVSSSFSGMDSKSTTVVDVWRERKERNENAEVYSCHKIVLERLCDCLFLPFFKMCTKESR
jgi:hypothetical protein